MHKHRKIVSFASLILLLSAVIFILLVITSVNSFSIQRIRKQTASPSSIEKPSALTLTKPIERRPPELVRIKNINGKVCAPWFAPTGDRILCYAGSIEHPELWLMSASEGLEKLLLKDELITFRWAYDNTSILYSPDLSFATGAVTSSSVQPLFLLNVDTGERREIGSTTKTAQLATVSSSEIIFQEQEVVKSVNLRSGTEKRVLNFSTTFYLPPSPPITDAQMGYEPTTIPDIFLTPSAEEMIPITITPSVDPLAPGCFPPSCDTRFLLSPDGKKLAIHQIFPQGNALVLVDVATQHTTLVTTQTVDSMYPFGWSPDSKRLAYTIVVETTRNPELWLVNADGTESRLLAAAKNRMGIYEYITWLPNNVDIVYVFTPSGSTTGQGAEYQVVSVEGGEPFILFTNGYGLEIFDGGRQLRFSREVHEGQFDPASWTAKLSDTTVNFLPLINQSR